MPIFILGLTIILATTRNLAAGQVGFDWIWPPPFGLVESQKSISPCGGFNGDQDLVTHYLNQLRWNQSAQAITYMTRVAPTLNITNDTVQWTELYPVVQAAMNTESASGVSNQFCIPVSQPAGINSTTTIFQLIANTPAGIIFACSRVSFQSTADQSFSQTCNPSIRGNNTVSNITDPTLLSAALLPPGATATPSASTSSELPVASSPRETSVAVAPKRKHISGGAIAGIVVGAGFGAGTIIAFLCLLFWRMHKTSSSGPKESSAEADTLGSKSNGRTTELPAVVPMELTGEETSRSELPGNEKLLRPELPSDSANDRGSDPIIPINKSHVRLSSDTAAVSPVTSSPQDQAGSPVSPIADRKHLTSAD